MALIFLCGVAAVFGLVLTWESSPGQLRSLRPAGLLAWLTAGNWMAKVGAGLIILGTGALLRYLLLQIDYPPMLKLASGVAASLLLGMGAAALQRQPQRRAIHLALGGASLGVAYLTSYSAYGYFGLVDDVQALGALFVVACAATAFALRSRALSIALLAMLGAFLAPAFALRDPGPVGVYGYYVAASTLALIMVWRRGWRAIAHLSFLFTLAGGVFFAWTQKFYTPQHYAQMHPLVLALIALHVAMPLLEQPPSPSDEAHSPWGRRFDAGYFLLLPLSAGALTMLLAPAGTRLGSLDLLELSGVWLAAAGIQRHRHGQGALGHVVVAAMFAALALLWTLDHPPYLLMAALLACAALAWGPKMGVPQSADDLLVTVALVSGACAILDFSAHAMTATPFFNTAFALRLLLALAFYVASRGLRERKGSFANLFFTLCVSWLFIVCIQEILRLQLLHLAVIAQAASLLACVAYAALLSRRAPQTGVVLTLGAALFISGVASADEFTPWMLIPWMVIGHGVFSVMAAMADRHPVQEHSAGSVARSLLPFVLLPFAGRYADVEHQTDAPVMMTLLALSAVSASVQARRAVPGRRLWANTLSPVGFVAFGGVLFYQTLFHIDRNAWAVAYDVVALVYLLITLATMQSEDARDTRLFGFIGVLASIFVAAAMLLRLVGPPGVMTILDLNDILFPAVLSLILAGIGASITWWATRVVSRFFWSVGVSLLIIAALKLVLFDFGSLGQIANILAMLGAGGLFLLVAWLAPFPPKSSGPSEHTSATVPRAAGGPPLGAADAIAASPSAADASSGRDATAARVSSASPSGAPPPPVGRHASGRTWIWIVCGLIVLFSYLPRHQAHPFAPTHLDTAQGTLRSAHRASTGNAQLDALLSAGVLQEAGPDDVEGWLGAYQRRFGTLPAKLAGSVVRGAAARVFLVKQSTVLPHQIPGINVFILAPGVSVPDPDVNLTLLKQEPLGCVGMLCGP